MSTNLVNAAVELFIKTKPMETLDVNIDSEAKLWYELYREENRLFDIIGAMTDSELNTYRVMVANIK